MHLKFAYKWPTAMGNPLTGSLARTGTKGEKKSSVKTSDHIPAIKYMS